MVLLREFHTKKNIEEDISSYGQTFEDGFSSSSVKSLLWNYTLKLRPIKEYDTQVRFGTWGVNVDLSNHIKNSMQILLLNSLL